MRSETLSDHAALPTAPAGDAEDTGDAGDGPRESTLIVPDMHCAACIQRIESGLADLAEVDHVRVNLSERTVRVLWHGSRPERITDRLTDLGFAWHPGEVGAHRGDDPVSGELVRALAVAGFAAGNVMLFSISIWSGATAETRDLFHWLSALIAVPAVAYAGRPFFRSALRSVLAGYLNMDVPISLAVILALAMSLFETASGGPHAYFDASVTLLFFLLIGRTLDHMMRNRARRAVAALARLSPDGATVVEADGSQNFRPLGQIAVGSTLVIRAGERVALDCRVVAGTADIDCALVTGESNPVAAGPGDDLKAGTLNLSGTLRAETIALSTDSFLARMRRMMRAAEESRAPYRRFADRMAAIYAPAVHGLAALTFIGWIVATGDWRAAAYAAIAVLVITCPCALGLAAPIVQVVAAGRLFEAGVMMRGGEALERAARIDRVVFDKTGTLTMGTPHLIEDTDQSEAHLAAAASLAAGSLHPLARAITEAARLRGAALLPVTGFREYPGQGMAGVVAGQAMRLGRPEWCGETSAEDAGPAPDASGATPPNHTQAMLAIEGRPVWCFLFSDPARPDARLAVDALQASGLGVEILSGDRPSVVQNLADRLRIADCAGGLAPEDKLARLHALGAEGTRVLMVGDGLNDAPALAAADVSMAPASAADIGRGQADFVFLHDSLCAVSETVEVARRARRLVRQNVALALVYNSVAVPLAMIGLATPLVAAIAMSSSSVLVMANALRLYHGTRRARAVG